MCIALSSIEDVNPAADEEAAAADGDDDVTPFKGQMTSLVVLTPYRWTMFLSVATANIRRLGHQHAIVLSPCFRMDWSSWISCPSLSRCWPVLQTWMVVGWTTMSKSAAAER